MLWKCKVEKLCGTFKICWTCVFLILFYGTQGKRVIMILSIKYMAAYLQQYLSQRFIGGSQIVLRPRIPLCTVRTLRCWRLILQYEVKLMKKKVFFLVNNTLEKHLKTAFKYTSLSFWTILSFLKTFSEMYLMYRHTQLSLARGVDFNYINLKLLFILCAKGFLSSFLSTFWPENLS